MRQRLAHRHMLRMPLYWWKAYMCNKEFYSWTTETITWQGKFYFILICHYLLEIMKFACINTKYPIRIGHLFELLALYISPHVGNCSLFLTVKTLFTKISVWHPYKIPCLKQDSNHNFVQNDKQNLLYLNYRIVVQSDKSQRDHDALCKLRQGK